MAAVFPFGKVVRGRGAHRFAKHGDKRIHGFIPEFCRHILHWGTARQLLQGDNQVQLLPPSPKAQPGLALHQARK